MIPIRARTAVVLLWGWVATAPVLAEEADMADPCAPQTLDERICSLFWRMVTPESAARIDPDTRYFGGLSPIQLAVTLSEDPAVTRTLIETGVPVDARDDSGDTALMTAGRLSESPETIEALLGAGASVEVTNADGETPLHAAAGSTGQLVIIDALLAAEAPIEAATTGRPRGATPLVYAARWNAEPAVLARLIEAGADTSVTVENGETLLHQAALGNLNSEVARTLVEAHGFAVDARDGGGETPLHKAAANPRSPGMIPTLVALGSPVDARRGDDDRTPLHVAAAAANTSAVLALLEAGADATLEDADGHAPLALASGFVGTRAHHALREASKADG